ncbi:MAG TPA: complex I NDUFA9 subunit family protein [Verrucomicrobiae bacterium]
MKVLVTGATGFVGQEVLQELHAAGHTTRLLARRPESGQMRKLTSEFNASAFSGNVLQAETLDTAMLGVDAVIHLVGIISEIGKQTFENVHVQAAQNVVGAAKRAGVRRFIHMSALGTRPKAASRYHQTKRAAEEIVRGSGLEWTVFRPSLIYGPGDHFVSLFAKLARLSPVLPVTGPGTAKMQPVAVGEVAACFVRALTEPSAAGRTFDVCGPETLTFPEILRAILAATGRKRFLVRVPLGVARVQAACLEWLYPVLLHRAPSEAY